MPADGELSALFSLLVKDIISSNVGHCPNEGEKIKSCCEHEA